MEYIQRNKLKVVTEKKSEKYYKEKQEKCKYVHSEDSSSNVNKPVMTNHIAITDM